MNFKKLTSVLLIFSLVFISFISCSDKNNSTEEMTDKEKTDTSSAVQTAFQELTTDRSGYKDSLPDDLNFNGREFKVLTHGGTNQATLIEFNAESINGDVINDAVYNRTKTVEERLGVTMKVDYSDAKSTAVGDSAKKNVKAGIHAYDLYNGHVMRMGQSILDNIYMDVYSLKNIDFTKPWWPKYAVENLSINKHAYLMVGEMNISALFASYAVFFNKDMAKDNGIDPSDIYKLVLEGKWTIDKQIEYTKMFKKDLNGDGVMKDDDDQYGLTTTTGFSAATYQWGFGQTICRMENGMPELNFPNPRMNSIVEKIYDLYFNSEGVRSYAYNEDWLSIFTSNKAFMMDHYLYSAITMRDYKGEFGIIPYPKFDESQDKYYSIADGFHNAFAVPITTAAEDYEFVGSVLEALNSETYRQVVPAYYDIALKVKYSRDNESVRILDMINEGRVFDFGCVYDGWTGFAFTISDLMQKKSDDFSSYYESKEKAANAYFDKIKECFDKLNG